MDARVRQISWRPAAACSRPRASAARRSEQLEAVLPPCACAGGGVRRGAIGASPRTQAARFAIPCAPPSSLPRGLLRGTNPPDVTSPEKGDSGRLGDLNLRCAGWRPSRPRRRVHCTPPVFLTVGSSSPHPTWGRGIRGLETGLGYARLTG